MKYYTATENLNQGKYLKCKVCLKKVCLQHSKSWVASKVLVRLRQKTLSLIPLSLLRLVGRHTNGLSYGSRR